MQMKRLLLIALAVSTIGLGSLSVNPTLAQNKMAGAQKPAAKKDNRASNVYVCKSCKVYYPAAAAKKLGFKDPMGHKLVHADKAPVGYKDGSKMKMGSKM
jgi:hypothetical protein